jgi:hypothetical protein
MVPQWIWPEPARGPFRIGGYHAVTPFRGTKSCWPMMQPEREELRGSRGFVAVVSSARMLPLRRVQFRKSKNAGPVDRSHFRGSCRRFSDLVDAATFCFVMFASCAPIVRDELRRTETRSCRQSPQFVPGKSTAWFAVVFHRWGAAFYRTGDCRRGCRIAVGILVDRGQAQWQDSWMAIRHSKDFRAT